MAAQINHHFHRIFKECRFAIIGMIHVSALPGTPLHKDSINNIITRCCKDAEIYESSGVNGVLIENMHDIPYIRSTDMSPEITATMTRVCTEVRKVIPADVACGVQVLAGANKEALAVALASGLQFIRAEGFVFGHVGDEGYIEACAGSLLRYRRHIGAEQIAIFTDIKKKHSSHAITADVSIEETAHAAQFFLSDGVVVTGGATAQPADLAQVQAVRAKSTLPVLIGSGVNLENIGDFVKCSDGAIIGSHFKHDGRSYNTLPWFYMDVWELMEVTCLGIDTALLVPCFAMFMQKRALMKCLKEAINVSDDPTNRYLIQMGSPKEIPYAVFTGEVHSSTGKPIWSTTTPGISGVIRRISIAERYVSDSARTWIESERFLSSKLECTSFMIRTATGEEVAVDKPLNAARLPLEPISDRYEPHRTPFVEILWEVGAMFRLVPGGRQQGLFLREEMLREGTKLTAIGALLSDGHKLKMSPPRDKPYVLSAHSFDVIRHQVHMELLFYKIIVALTTVVGVSLASHLVWRRFGTLQHIGVFQLDVFEVGKFWTTSRIYDPL